MLNLFIQACSFFKLFFFKFNISFYLETSGGQNSNPYLNVAPFLNTRPD